MYHQNRGRFSAWKYNKSQDALHWVKSLVWVPGSSVKDVKNFKFSDIYSWQTKCELNFFLKIYKSLTSHSPCSKFHQWPHGMFLIHTDWLWSMEKPECLSESEDSCSLSSRSPKLGGDCSVPWLSFMLPIIKESSISLCNNIVLCVSHSQNTVNLMNSW